MRMLQAGNADPEQLLQAMHICRDQSKRAGRIIQRLRGLLRHPGPALAEQDLNELVAAVLELAEPGARDAGVVRARAFPDAARRARRSAAARAGGAQPCT